MLRQTVVLALATFTVLALGACAAGGPTSGPAATVAAAPIQGATAALPTRVATFTPPGVVNVATPTAPAGIPATWTLPAPSTREANYRIEIAVFDATGRTAVSAPVGSQVALTIAFRPYKDVITTRADGTTNKYSTNWNTSTIKEMRYCTGQGLIPPQNTGSPICTLPDRWVPFATEQHVTVSVDWFGTRVYGVTAQFRDANGKIIPAGLNLGDVSSNWVPVTGAVDDRTPVAAQPLAVQTIIAQARTAFPLQGSVKVGNQSMMGGKAGTTVNIPVHFEASSPAGAVTEMRVKQYAMGRCLTPEEMSDAKWEPFVADKVYQTSIALNFSTFKLHVQYRDAKGNLSQVYCGEVTLEGNP